MRHFVIILLFFSLFYSPARAQENILPPLPPSMVERLTQPIGTLTIPTIFFATGSSQLTVAQKSTLKSVAVKLKGLKVYIIIDAYTDSVGDSSTNLILSKDRSLSVANELTKEGLHPNQVFARGNGENFASNTEGNGQSSDRKVVATIRITRDDYTRDRDNTIVELKARGVPIEYLELANLHEVQTTLEDPETITKQEKQFLLGAQISPVAIALRDGEFMQGSGVSFAFEPFAFNKEWSLLLKYSSLNFGSHFKITTTHAGTTFTLWNQRYINLVIEGFIGNHRTTSSNNGGISSLIGLGLSTSLRANIPKTSFGGIISTTFSFDQDTVILSLFLGFSVFL